MPRFIDHRRQLEVLAKLEIGDFRFDEPLAPHCSWRIGGPADLLVEPRGVEELSAVIHFARRQTIPLVVIGRGTNLLFDDAGLRGIVVKIGRHLSRIEIAGRRIVAEAGVFVPHLARRAARAGLAGLEHAIGIPGSLGGLVLMNGGSGRRAVGENVRRVWVVDREGRLEVLTGDECGFDYRHTTLMDMGAVVAKVELECAEGDRREMRRAMLADLRERRRKYPRKGEPNCGSVFLSTASMHCTVGPPGKIIEEAGLKGFRIGGAEISPRHANFIVNRGGATSRDVLAVIGHIQCVVREKIGFELHCEVRYVSPGGEMLPADEAAAR